MYAKLQEPDGYLNAGTSASSPDKRWTNLRDCHELYCAGHLIEGAVAYFQATGKRKLLDVMCRYVDHIATTLRPRPGQKRGYCGHEEIELALVKLCRASPASGNIWTSPATSSTSAASQPHYFDVEARARGDDPDGLPVQRRYEYNQSHKPVREQDKVVGHAVRAMYLYSAMADLAAEHGDDSLSDRAASRCGTT